MQSTVGRSAPLVACCSILAVWGPSRVIEAAPPVGFISVSTTQLPDAGTVGSFAASAPLATKQSIRHWAVCDGRTDDTRGVTQAFAAAAGGAFTLLIDCPVRLRIASDIDKPIFVDDDTTVQFTPFGTFIVDNTLQPAFVLAGSRNVTLTDWNVEYVGRLPVQPDVGGYERAGKFVKMAGYAQPAAAFNDLRLTPWLAAHRHIVFHDGVTSEWPGPTNLSAIFLVTGDVSNMRVSGMRLHVPPTAGGERFIPMAFSLSRNFRGNQTVGAETAKAAEYRAVPHDIEFTNIELDGTYMGWQGTVQNATFTNIQSHRYGDLQDANGQNVGGVGKWFAPPHLFYINYDTKADPGLFSRNISIANVVDDGPRVGVARDRGGGDTISGYALSLKLGCVSCRVSEYRSSRPDGFLDLLDSSQLTIENVSATYDSAFLNNIYPGWRFPSAAPSLDVTAQNISLSDTADVSQQRPIGNASQVGNRGIVLKNVTVTVGRWSGSGSIAPWISGEENDLAVQYVLRSSHSRLVYVSKGGMALSFQVQPDTISSSQSVLLSWASSATSGCTASGSWTGAMAGSGSRIYKPLTSGSATFSLGCKGPTGTGVATLPVNVL